jgi:hypothetical protein
MGAHSLSPCIRIGLWTGFVGVHGKDNALSFYAREAVSATGNNGRNGRAVTP